MQLYEYLTRETRKGYIYHSIDNPKKRTQHALELNRETLSRLIRNNKDTELSDMVRKKSDREVKVDFLTTMLFTIL